MQLTAPRGTPPIARASAGVRSEILSAYGRQEKSPLEISTTATAIDAWSKWRPPSLFSGRGSLEVSAAFFEDRQHGIAEQQCSQLTVGADAPAIKHASPVASRQAACAEITLQSMLKMRNTFAKNGSVLIVSGLIEPMISCFGELVTRNVRGPTWTLD